MRVTILADASFCPDSRAAGYGYWIASDRGKRGGGAEIRNLDAADTSEHVEAMALVNSLHVARASGLVQDGDEVLLQTDCLGAILKLRSGRPGRIGRPFRALCEGLAIDYKHVKGHTSRKTHPETRYAANRHCDRRARHWMEKARERIRIEGLANELVPQD